MKSLIFTVTLLLAFLFPLSSHAYYNINLQNGEVLEAEDYKVEGNKLNIRFKVGSASFPLSMVKSVTDQAGRESVFSSTGEQQAPAPAAPPVAAPAPPVQPQPPNVAAPQSPAPPLAAHDPLTATGGTKPGVANTGQPAVEEDTEEFIEEVPDPNDESSDSGDAIDLTH